MPEKNDDKSDVVNKEDYNKIVEAHNTVKTEKETLMKEIEDLKNEKVEDKEKVEKNEWAKQKEELEKQKEELQKQVDDKSKEEVIKKGIVKQNEDAKDVGKEQEKVDLKAMLDKTFPDRDKNPERYGSNVQRWGHYKSPTTKVYSTEQLGQVISLVHSAQTLDPSLVNANARINKHDIVVN